MNEQDRCRTQTKLKLIRNDIQSAVSLDRAHIAEAAIVLKLTFLGSHLFAFHQTRQDYRISLESAESDSVFQKAFQRIL